MNQLPTTDKQIRLYKSLTKYNVQYVLIGALAAMFYGRNRGTGNIDILIQDASENYNRLLDALREIGYLTTGTTLKDFEDYEQLRFGGETVVNVYMKFGGVLLLEAENTRDFNHGMNRLRSLQLLLLY